MFKSRVFLLTAYLFFVAPLFGQKFEWAKSNKGNGASKEAKVTTYEDGLYMARNFKGSVKFADKVINGKGKSDVYLAKLNMEGKLTWAVSAGGTDDDKLTDFTIDKSGNIILTGYFSGIAQFGNISLQSQGCEDIFIAKYDKDGKCIWAKNLGGNNADKAFSVYTDQSENIIVTGTFTKTCTFERTQLKAYGNTDIFILALDKKGKLDWVEKITTYDDRSKPTALSIDKSGNIYVTGNLIDNLTFQKESAFTDTSLAAVKLPGIFLMKLNKKGNLIWLRNVKAADLDSYLLVGNGITIDEKNNLYITGGISGGAKFDNLNVSGTGLGNQNVFIAKADNNGSWQWVKLNGSPDYEYVRNFGTNIISDNNNSIYTSGYFNGLFELDQYKISGNGGQFDSQIFITKISIDGNVEWIKTTSSNNNDIFSFDNVVSGITYYEEDLFITGTFSGNISFDENILKSEGKKDVFISKIGKGNSTNNLKEAFTAEEKASTFSVYPNPASDVFNLSFKGDGSLIKIEVIDTNGEVVLKQKQQTDKDQSYNIYTDISGITPGIYQVKVVSGSNIELFKLIIL